jgi:hypothetical protein
MTENSWLLLTNEKIYIHEHFFKIFQKYLQKCKFSNEFGELDYWMQNRGRHINLQN